MDMCRLPMQLPAINLRYEHTSPFRPLLVRCNMSQNAESMESANGQMFVLGMGFVGQFFAADLKSKGWSEFSLRLRRSDLLSKLSSL